MLSTWLFIILFNTTDAQILTLPSQQACYELKAFTDNEINKLPKLKGKIATGCFKNMGKRNMQS